MNDKYNVRADLIARGYNKLVAKFERQENENAINGVIQDPVQDDIYFELVNSIGLKGIKECHRINKNKDNRTYQLRKRMKVLLEYPCLFLTLTFTDETLAKTNEKTRREYVVNFFNSFANNGYIANIDYGVDDRYTKREHYHAIVATEKVSQDLWPHGNLDWQRVRVKGKEKDKTIKAVPKYLSKLVNHAIKDSGKKVKLIYSRRNKNNETSQHPLKTKELSLERPTTEMLVSDYVYERDSRGKMRLKKGA